MSSTICFVTFNRKPAPATIKLILASGPKPSTTEHRYPRFAEIEDGAERRRTVIRLHANGWNAKSIVGYLEVSRQTAHAILRRFAEGQFAGLSDKSHARTGLRKVDITRCAFIFPSGVTISQGYGKNAFLGQHLEALNLPCCF